MTVECCQQFDGVSIVDAIETETFDSRWSDWLLFFILTFFLRNLYAHVKDFVSSAKILDIVLLCSFYLTIRHLWNATIALWTMSACKICIADLHITARKRKMPPQMATRCFYTIFLQCLHAVQHAWHRFHNDSRISQASEFKKCISQCFRRFFLMLVWCYVWRTALRGEDQANERKNAL